ncbi:hypothetical protein ALC60_11178 [Trachymyrmex zeteki]|uniref:Uncharacterized protein n=1 Tax=Mycetomoellerius zeteki TaxID=64791 RepID=A0A151WPL0_9HYME|nr:hypothetical protein ALC60_11178 [Trachymyrmex zeteki]
MCILYKSIIFLSKSQRRKFYICSPKFVSDRNRYVPVEGINLEVIYELGTSIRNNFPVCIVAALLPRTLLIPLYPGASSHDVAKRPRSQGGDV